MNHIKHLIFISTLATSLCSATNALADTNLKPGDIDNNQIGSQYLAYPVPTYGIPQLTPSPDGYVPFHIEHYGRHGSRWLHKDDGYKKPVKYLSKAQKYGKLTERGEKLLQQLKEIADSSENRIGELTPLGHRQHRDIARRMTENFPEIFVPGTHVDAKSTVVIRCILSMANEIAEIQRLHPYVTVTCDASRTTQKLLAYSDSTSKKISKANFNLSDSLENKISDYSSFVNKVFNDPKFVADSLNAQKVFTHVFDVAVNGQSHDNWYDIYDVFTPQELLNQWMANNAWWYINSGNTSLTENRIPYTERYLLKDFVCAADTAMTSPRLSVNLRFGHESIVLAMAILMDINKSNYDTTDLYSLADNWHNYEIFPMASNIQLIFYRPAGNTSLSPDDVLVKVLLNEKEAELPLTAVSGPYYRWSDVRSLWMDKLDNFSKRFGEDFGHYNPRKSF